MRKLNEQETEDIADLLQTPNWRVVLSLAEEERRKLVDKILIEVRASGNALYHLGRHDALREFFTDLQKVAS
jgi:hypothetical protein